MGRKKLIPVDHEILTSDPASPPSGYVRQYWRDGWLVAEDSAGVRTYLNQKHLYLISADASNTTTTPATVSALSFDVENGGRYRARWTGAYTTGATTTGIRIGIDYATAGTDGSLVWQFLGDLNTGASQVGGASGATDTHNQPSASGPAGTFQPFWMECFFHSGADQTLDFRLWSEVGGSAATIKTKSMGTLWRLDD